MPIYEYRCSSCGNEFETLVRGSSPAPDCPKCHGTKLQKKLSSFAAVVAAPSSSRSQAFSPCQSCGHPDGPGACQFNS
jgi:putative FmdB family regulatory protein